MDAQEWVIDKKRWNSLKSLGFVGVGAAYSPLLKRAALDFVADESFPKATQKFKEHYDLDFPQSTLQAITYATTLQMSEANPVVQTPVAKATVSMDGSYIRTCVAYQGTEDARKHRCYEWVEAKLANVHTDMHNHWACTLENAEMAGRMWWRLGEQTGINRSTFVHAVGDGATWLLQAHATHFSTQGRYLIDWFHVQSYLGTVMQEHRCSPDWLNRQQTHLLNGKPSQVLCNLQRLVLKETPDGTQSATTALRYLTVRKAHLFYDWAKKYDCEIGSGRIESGHKFLQKRLKVRGAAWTPRNAQCMIQLLVLRANQHWETFWNEHTQ